MIWFQAENHLSSTIYFTLVTDDQRKYFLELDLFMKLYRLNTFNIEYFSYIFFSTNISKIFKDIGFHPTYFSGRFVSSNIHLSRHSNRLCRDQGKITKETEYVGFLLYFISGFDHIISFGKNKTIALIIVLEKTIERTNFHLQSRQSVLILPKCMSIYTINEG